MAESDGLESRRPRTVEIRTGLRDAYADVYTLEALAAIEALAPLDDNRKKVMASRIERRSSRYRDNRRITFLDPEATIPGTDIRVQDARDGNFVGGEIPHDLECQWIQGTGPAAKPHSPIERSIRNVAYALLSGADGWMFDGEDALGQIDTMALDNQRNLKLALARDQVFLDAAEGVASDMNRWAQSFFGRDIVTDWREQLGFTTVLFRPRGLHLDDRHIRNPDGSGSSASLVDVCLFVVNNREALLDAGRSLVLYLPKIQTGEEAALWNTVLTTLEDASGPRRGHHQGVCARRTGRGRVPAHGDPRGAGQALRGLQHGSLGLHQLRGRCGRLGLRLHRSQHRVRRHDLRLHASLRRPGAAGDEHARPRG